MLKGSLTMVGYGKTRYRAILTPNWKTHFIAGPLWGNLTIQPVSLQTGRLTR